MAANAACTRTVQAAWKVYTTSIVFLSSLQLNLFSRSVDCISIASVVRGRAESALYAVFGCRYVAAARERAAVCGRGDTRGRTDTAVTYALLFQL